MILLFMATLPTHPCRDINQYHHFRKQCGYLKKKKKARYTYQMTQSFYYWIFSLLKLQHGLTGSREVRVIALLFLSAQKIQQTKRE